MSIPLSGFIPRGPANLHELGVAARRAAIAEAKAAAAKEAARAEREARRRQRAHDRDPRVRLVRAAHRDRKSDFAKIWLEAQREYDAFVAEQDRHFRGGRPSRKST